LEVMMVKAGTTAPSTVARNRPWRRGSLPASPRRSASASTSGDSSSTRPMAEGMKKAMNRPLATTSQISCG
jgi:hypothetical protein